MQRSVQAIGHQCSGFERGEALLRELRRESFDLLIVDWQLPDVPGIEVIRQVRAKIPHRMPILLLTNRGEERDVVLGLSCGADDYMVKPTRVRELMARVQALLRRSYPAHESAELRYGGYRFDTAARTLAFDGRPIELTQKEFDLARCLFANQGRLLSRAYLLDAVWGGLAAGIPSRSLDTHMSSLRAKLNLRPARGYRLSAVYGHGYRLEALGPPEAAQPAEPAPPAAVPR